MIAIDRLQKKHLSFLNKLTLNKLFFLASFHSSLLSVLVHFKTSSILFGNGLFNVSGTYKPVNPHIIAINP